MIDEDLGHSATGVVDRAASNVWSPRSDWTMWAWCWAWKCSRLARSGREWHQLLELRAPSGALLVDPDGVYDPAERNDRMPLGLKGTISEAELHLIKERMWNGRIGKARCGELAVPLPVGYLRRPDGQVVRDSDQQVQAWSAWSSTCSTNSPRSTRYCGSWLITASRWAPNP
ncbi:recombinase family protein [Streptomyces mirabilis]|uniref:recombinase family protein n=1 Tax=Streptomyces mirabilis TaxID=68239 RepID=UPI0036C2B739